MDFFGRQNDVLARSRAFYLVFGLTLPLAVIVFYFAVAGCFLLVAFSLAVALPIKFALTGDLWSSCLYLLPKYIFGYPQEIIALRPFLTLGTLILTIILASAIYKTRAIRRGGGAYVAEAMGGRLIGEPKNPSERQLVNVVEEMAVAAGLPCPRIYVLSHERSINAVTAGLSPEDAIVAVTQGALNHLTRDELQGVVAHEFAHILNGDYTLNLTMAGWLYGLLFFSVQGQDIMAIGSSIIDVSPQSQGANFIFPGLAIYLAGLILWLGGWLGKAAAEIVQAAFSREREHLADAFAVQFTRNPRGLAGALKKIAGSPRAGALQSGQALMMKSFFISSPASLSRLWQSHPPLEERIFLLEPDWDGQLTAVDFKSFEPPVVGGKLKTPVRPDPGGHSKLPQGFERLAGKAKVLGDNWTGALVLGLLTNGGEPQKSPLAESGSVDLAAMAGRSLELARSLCAQIPRDLRLATEDPVQVKALICAFFMADQGEVRSKQWDMVRTFFNEETAKMAAGFCPQLVGEHKLALLSLAAPALKNLSDDEGHQLSRVVKALVAADGKLDLFEIAACQILKKYLSLGPPVKPALGLDYFTAIQEDVVLCLSALAYLGATGSGEAQEAFASGLAHFNQWPPFEITPQELVTAKELSQALNRLSSAPEKVKKILVLAAVGTALHDQVVGQKEYEMLRALAAALDVPLPMLGLDF